MKICLSYSLPHGKARLGVLFHRFVAQYSQYKPYRAQFPNVAELRVHTAFKKENYETSQGIGASLFRQIEEVAADFVATDCETCKWQIEMSTPAKVKHPISILAEALDLEATRKLNSDK